MNKLNPQQRTAVVTTDQPLLVLAGAGSGKTRVITEKIAHLANNHLPAKNIAALTFTNKAAKQMQTRVGKLLERKKQRGLRISTFHSLGFDILRLSAGKLGYKPRLSLFDEQDKYSLLRDLLGGNTAPGDIAAYAKQISDWKNALLNPEQALAQASPEQQQTAALYHKFNRSLKAYNGVDFDDLILLPVELFSLYGEVLETWKNKIRYLLVDEYQDTNIAQYKLLRALAGNSGNFTVVGDDDQSIYAWRGANPHNLEQLAQDYPDLQVVKLEQNYRSTGRILQVASALIANNPHAYSKKLWSNLGFGDPLPVLQHKNEIAEAQQIVAEIIHHKFRNGASYGDYAILYRSNHQSRLFENYLRENNIAYFISGGTSFFARSEVKDILAYLRLFVNPDDDVAFLRIINTPARGIGVATLEKLAHYAGKRHSGLLGVCCELGLGQILASKHAQKLQTFGNWVASTSNAIASADTFAAIDHFIEQIGYRDWLLENSKTPASGERKYKNVLDLIAWLQRLASKDGDYKTIDEVLGKIMLMDILASQDDNQDHDRISLMTLHAAKGLEFPHVFLVGMEEQLLPHKNSIATNDIEEERRLTYVGITRAQQTCTFSYCTHRKTYGDTNQCQPSRFLQELPAEDLEWANRKQLDPATVKNRAKANIADLKRMLN